MKSVDTIEPFEDGLKLVDILITATHDLSIVEEIAQRVIVLRENHTIATDG